MDIIEEAPHAGKLRQTCGGVIFVTVIDKPVELRDGQRPLRQCERDELQIARKRVYMVAKAVERTHDEMIAGVGVTMRFANEYRETVLERKRRTTCRVPLRPSDKVVIFLRERKMAVEFG